MYAQLLLSDSPSLSFQSHIFVAALMPPSQSTQLGIPISTYTESVDQVRRAVSLLLLGLSSSAFFSQSLEYLSPVSRYLAAAASGTLSAAAYSRHRPAVAQSSLLSPLALSPPC